MSAVVQILPVAVSSQEASHGIFYRLKLVTQWISHTIPSLFNSFPLYVRQQIQFFESLSYYMLNFNSQLYYRYDPMKIFLNGTNSTIDWILLQISFSLLANNHTIISSLPEDLMSQLQNILNQHEIFQQYIQLSNELVFFGDNIPDQSYQYEQQILYNDRIIQLESVYPEFKQLLKKRVQNWTYISNLYQCDAKNIPSDEFDYLSDNIRLIFVQQRTAYLHYIVQQTSLFYQQKLLSNADIPYLDGVELSRHVPPYGHDLISRSGEGGEHYNYNISFATGGTSNIMKYVYRLTWEDEENARYLAKGLYSQGITSSDVVMNCLSSGFWGGMHVFNLALKYLGCAVIPIGPNFKNSEIIQFIQDFNPSILLAIPSFLLKLSEYVENIPSSIPTAATTVATTVATATATAGNPLQISINGVITGGELLYDGMKTKIETYLHVKRFYSTGYTSNETGAIGFRCEYLPLNYFHIHENMQTVKIKSVFPSETDNQTNWKRFEEVTTTATTTIEGQIICTNLNRTYMPVLEYSIGDSGVLRRSLESNSCCQCGRKLQILELKGRWDDRIRIGGEDIYSSQIANILNNLYGLTLNFTMNIFKSISTSRDVLDIHVERSEGVTDADIIIHYNTPSTTATTSTIPTVASLSTSLSREDANQLASEILIRQFRDHLKKNTGLNWYENETGNPHNDQSEICEEGIIDPPILTLLPSHQLERNLRTGKIKRIIDQR